MKAVLLFEMSVTTDLSAWHNVLEGLILYLRCYLYAGRMV